MVISFKLVFSLFLVKILDDECWMWNKLLVYENFLFNIFEQFVAAYGTPYLPLSLQGRRSWTNRLLVDKFAWSKMASP